MSICCRFMFGLLLCYIVEPQRSVEPPTMSHVELGHVGRTASVVDRGKSWPLTGRAVQRKSEVVEQHLDKANKPFGWLIYCQPPQTCGNHTQKGFSMFAGDQGLTWIQNCHMVTPKRIGHLLSPGELVVWHRESRHHSTSCRQSHPFHSPHLALDVDFQFNG